MSRYGLMTTNNAATAQAGFTSTPAKLANIGASGIYEGVNVVHADNKIIIKTPGLYQVFAQVSFAKGAADGADNFHVFLYRNGLSTGFGFARYMAAAVADVGSGSLYGILDLNVNDVLELYLFTDGAGPYTITVVDAQFGVIGL